LHALENNVVIAIFSEPPPSLDNVFYCRTFLGILVPATPEELPYLGGEADRLRVSWHHHSTSSRDTEQNRFVLLSFKWYLTGEDLRRKHGKSEHVSSF